MFQVFILWRIYGDGASEKELNLFDLSYGQKRLAVGLLFPVGYLMMRSNFRLGSVILTVAAVFTVMVKGIFRPDVIGAIGFLLLWFTQVYPFLLFFRLLTGVAKTQRDTGDLRRNRE